MCLVILYVVRSVAYCRSKSCFELFTSSSLHVLATDKTSLRYEGDDLFYTLVKWVGSALIGYATGSILLIQGMETLQAVGYGWVSFSTLCFLDSFRCWNEKVNILYLVGPGHCCYWNTRDLNLEDVNKKKILFYIHLNRLPSVIFRFICYSKHTKMGASTPCYMAIFPQSTIYSSNQSDPKRCIM
jgi:hypothetical protein